MPGSFQPAKLDVDSSILDSNLKVISDPEDQFAQLFPSSQTKKTVNPIDSLLSPQPEYSSTSVVPKPGICVKTKNAAGDKFFINLCKISEIPAPPPIEEKELTRLIETEDYTSLWRVPMSLGTPRQEVDKAGGRCWAAEVAVNSAWFEQRMVTSDLFTGFVLTIAMEGLCDKYGEDARLDRDKWTVLKNKKFLGDIAKCPAHHIQLRQNPGIETIEKHSPSPGGVQKPVAGGQQKNNSLIIEELSETRSRGAEPVYSIERVSDRQLRLRVCLPGVASAADLALDVGEDRVVVAAARTSAHLDIFLPGRLDSDNTSAKFVVDEQVLLVYIPLL